MDERSHNLLIADALLLIHAAFVVFVIAGLVLIFAGRALSWAWVRNPWFRVLHLCAIAVVVLQAWLGVLCPLTTWEMHYRALAGDTTYDGSFISYWVSRLLYYRAPPWVFTVLYTAFGAVVASSWVVVRPHSFRRSHAMRED